MNELTPQRFLTEGVYDQDRDVWEAALVLAEKPLRPIPQTQPLTPPSRRRLKFWLSILALCLLSLAAAAYWYWWSAKTPPVQFKTAQVDRGSITATVTATGTVNPVISVQVGSQVTGKIIKLFADYNSSVKEGQPVAQIDPAPFDVKVVEARAILHNARGSLHKAEVDLDQHRIELARMINLREHEFVAQSDLDLARTNARDAEAQVEQARAALASAELDLSHTTISSPVDGVVVSRNVDVGQTVAASLQAPTLFIIAQDLTRMQVDANVSESDIGGVAEGKTADFTVDAYPHEQFSGTVVQVRNAPISIQNVVTYDVVINVDNRALKLKPGMTANVSIVTANKPDTLRVPNTALRFKMPGAPTDRKKPTVWELNADGRARPVTLTPGIADSMFTEVEEGDLGKGDLVIVGVEIAEEMPQKELPPGFGVAPKIR